MLKTLDALSYFSIVGVLSILYVATLTILYGLGIFDPCKGVAADQCPGDNYVGLPGKFTTP